MQDKTDIQWHPQPRLLAACWSSRYSRCNCYKPTRTNNGPLYRDSQWRSQIPLDSSTTRGKTDIRWRQGVHWQPVY